MTKTYKVSIIETFQLEVEVIADSTADAQYCVEKCYKDGKYVLDSSNFKQVNFVARTAEKTQNRGKRER